MRTLLRAALDTLLQNIFGAGNNWHIIYLDSCSDSATFRVALDFPMRDYNAKQVLEADEFEVTVRVINAREVNDA